MGNTSVFAGDGRRLYWAEGSTTKGNEIVIKDITRRLAFSILQPIADRHIHRGKFCNVEVKTQGDLGMFLFWRRPSAEELFLSTLDLKGKTVYNLGAYIAVHAIFYAKAVGPTGRVIAFEPNPQNYEKAKNNIKINLVKNVNILNIAIGDQNQTREIAFLPYRPASGTLAPSIQSSILKNKEAKTVDVQSFTLDKVVDTYNLPKPDLISMDVEGMEYQALQGALESIKLYKPALFIEIHGADEQSALENITVIQQFLSIHNYTIYHVESKSKIDNHNISRAHSGHVYCENIQKQRN